MKTLKILKKKTIDQGNIIQNHDAKLITFLNPYSYIFYRKNPQVFTNFDIIYLDGILLVLLMRMVSKKAVRNSFDMTSLAARVFEDSITRKKTIFFIGAKKDEIERFIKNIEKSFNQDLDIKGFRGGYFIDKSEESEIIKKITLINPDILIVGMGTPMQEEFLIRMRRNGWKGTGYTCGGFLHQTAKKAKYYPDFINKYNLRWLFRIYDEPKLLKRYGFEYPKSIGFFTFDFLKYCLKNKK